MARVSLSARSLTKRYGGVVALSDASLDVESGEVLALLGANGSGKSTLGKIVTGAVVPDGGQLLLDGKEINFSSPQAARRHGIAAVYQELSLIPDMSVAENIWLTHEPLGRGRVKKKERRERTIRLLDLFSGTVSPSLAPESQVASLSASDRQVVEILKALSLEPRIVILDEATASLDSNQVSRLFDLVSEWKQENKAVVFISHRMEEIFRLADRATVLRSGETVGSVEIEKTDEERLVEMMIEGGAESRRTEHPPPDAEAPVVLSTDQLNNEILDDVNLELREGELLGLGGLQGQGQQALLLALFGDVPFSGRVSLSGSKVDFTHPRQAMRQGVAYVPGDRGEGLLPVRSILENLLLPSLSRYKGVLRMGEARKDAGSVAEDLNLVMGSLDSPVSTLSGGNAQKVVLGKWLLRDPKVLLLDDPTKGVDVGAKEEFYKILDHLRESGVAILLYSSDDDELLGLCDRVLVMRDGRVQDELERSRLTRSELVSASMGTSEVEQ